MTACTGGLPEGVMHPHTGACYREGLAHGYAKAQQVLRELAEECKEEFSALNPDPAAILSLEGILVAAAALDCVLGPDA